MQRILLPMIAACLTTQQGMAQEDNEIVLPHGKCGTAMLWQKEMGNSNMESRAIGSYNPQYVPHTGKITIPVILVNLKKLLNNSSMARSKPVWATAMPRTTVL